MKNILYQQNCYLLTYIYKLMHNKKMFTKLLIYQFLYCYVISLLGYM